MDRIYKSGAVQDPPDPPATPSAGYPTGKDAQTGTPPTDAGAYWFHMVTESLTRIVEWAGFTPDHLDFDLVRKGIALANSRMLSLRRQVTAYDYTKHKGFALMDVLPSGRIMLIYRESTEHGVAESVIREVHSDDGGLTWSAPVTIQAQSGRDLRGISGGVDSQGNFHLIYRTAALAGSDQKGEAITSSDNGETWSTPYEFFSTTGSAHLTMYGKLVETATEIFVLAINTTSDELRKIASDDDGATWTQTSIQTIPTELTEPSCVHVGNNNIVCLLRNNTLDANPSITISEDDGATWSAVSAISNIETGKNAHQLWYDPATDLIHLLFSSRGDAELSSGGVGHLRPFYIASITADELINGSGVWRRQHALPIFGPDFDAGGDGGYPHFVRSNGVVLMSYYLGNQSDGGGADLYIANLTTAAGVE